MIAYTSNQISFLTLFPIIFSVFIFRFEDLHGINHYPFAFYHNFILIFLIFFLQIAQLVEDVQRLQATVSKLRDSSAAQVNNELHIRKDNGYRIRKF